MKSVSELLNELNNGILPKELDFNNVDDTSEEEYMAQLQYNTFYKNPYYFINKFPNPKAFMNLPGAEQIIDEMVANAKTPLEEMLERQIPSEEFKEDTEIISNDNNIDESK